MEINSITSNAVQIFTTVRDIPYILGCEGDPEGIIDDGYGGCTRKHLYLALRLRALGYKVSIGMSTFDWRDLPIPPEILQNLRNPIQYHMFLYLKNETPSMLIDATWDKQMGVLGFPTLNWDGESSTGLGVEPLHVWEEKLWVLKIKALASTIFYRAKNPTINLKSTPFNDSFNSWLESIRT